MSIHFEPIWFDSMGAKSACTLVRTPDINILIDPGVAIMQPSFPATIEQKTEWLATAENKIKEVCKKVDIQIISHYHYDHYFPDDLDIYRKKIIFIKNPNEYINHKQRTRGEEFYKSICKKFEIKNPKKISEQKKTDYPDPLDELPHATKKDFRSYNKRRKEVLEKGRKRFFNYVKEWSSFERIPEIESDDIKIIFPEEKTFTFGDTSVSFSKPLFHGIEYAGVGWVFATIIKHKDKKLLHSSDVSGPMIEDYADLIIKQNPSILILDGPTTYLFGYILNKINLTRTIDNTVRIVKEIDADVIIYDHHLTRENKFREHTKAVWDTALVYDKKVMTAAEYLGKKTVVEMER